MFVTFKYVVAILISFASIKAVADSEVEGESAKTSIDKEAVKSPIDEKRENWPVDEENVKSPINEEVVKSPIEGFPGAFDTSLPPVGKFALSATYIATSFLPLIGAPVEYGVTDWLSIGTNLGVPIYFATGDYAWGGKIRLRENFGPRFSLAQTLYYYGTTDKAKTTKSRAAFGIFTANYSYSDEILFMGFGGAFSSSSSTGLKGNNFENFTQKDTFLIMLGGQWIYYFIHAVGVRAAAFAPIFLEEASDSGISTDLTPQVSLYRFIVGKGTLAAGAVSADFKIEDNWLLSLGFASATSDAKLGWYCDLQYLW